MGFPVTRQQWRSRMVRESHRQGDTGTATATDQNSIIQDVYNSWQDDLATRSGRSAIGKAFRVVTVASDSDTVDLFTEFRSLFGFRRSDARHAGPHQASLSHPHLLLQDTALHAGLLDPDPPTCPPEFQGGYYLEGPGQFWDPGSQQLITIGLRIRVFPRLPANESLTIVYRTQPLFLGDPEVVDTGVDLDPIELMSAANYDAASAHSRIVFSARSDQGELQRAIADRGAAIQAFLKSMGSEDRHGVVGVDQYAHPGQPTQGYG